MWTGSHKDQAAFEGQSGGFGLLQGKLFTGRMFGELFPESATPSEKFIFFGVNLYIRAHMQPGPSTRRHAEFLLIPLKDLQ
jgi:hypothetical protein